MTPAAPAPPPRNFLHTRHVCRTLGLGAATLLAAAALTACGTSGTTAADGSPTASTTPSPASAASAGGTGASASGTTTADATSAEDTLPPMSGASLERKERLPEADGLYVEDVRVGHHDGFDRIVFEISGGDAPGYIADYTTEPTQQASGFPIEYEGAVALNIGISALALPFELDRPDPPTGPIENTSAGIITGVTHSGIFEAQGQYVVGLQREVPYSINVIQEPTRIVVDFLTQ